MESPLERRHLARRQHGCGMDELRASASARRRLLLPSRAEQPKGRSGRPETTALERTEVSRRPAVGNPARCRIRSEAVVSARLDRPLVVPASWPSDTRSSAGSEGAARPCRDPRRRRLALLQRDQAGARRASVNRAPISHGRNRFPGAVVASACIGVACRWLTPGKHRRSGSFSQVKKAVSKLAAQLLPSVTQGYEDVGLLP